MIADKKYVLTYCIPGHGYFLAVVFTGVDEAGKDAVSRIQMPISNMN